jgi:pilus assembly protein TadC
MRKLIYRLLLVKLIFALVLFVQGYWYWLLNFELAFFASMFIIFGSFSGYKRMVQRRLDAGEGLDDVLLEKIEDPYALYEDEASVNDEEADLKEVIKEEKKRLKQNKETFKKTVKSTTGILSPWRFLPYIFLVLSFIALNNNHILDIFAFLLGLGLGILSAVIIGKSWIKTLS